MSVSHRRLSIRLLVVAVVLGALAVPAAAPAAVSTFERFEVLAVGDFRITETCDDGRVVSRRVRVTGGHEEESEDGTQTVSDDFMLVQLQGASCNDPSINDTFNGEGVTFTWSPSLQTATLQGTLTQADGDTVTVDLTWEGTGPLEVNQNTSTFPGFTGHFTGRRRDAVATGTVVLNGETIVDGSTSIAEIESLEDKNISHG